MKKLFLFSYLLLTVIAVNANHVLSSDSLESNNRHCTIVAGLGKNGLIVGNNEDWIHPFSHVSIIPGSDKEYGRLLFMFHFETYEVSNGGINEKGLFIDVNGTGRTGWQPGDGKMWIYGNVIDMLGRFATVKEVIDWIKNSNYVLGNGKFLVADKSGASAVVEWGNGKLQFIERKGKYQISTNFIQSNYTEGKYPDFRYNLAEKIFQESNDISIDLIKNVLDATHWEEYSGSSITTTLYSYIAELSKGDVYIYNFHDFDHPVKMNIYEELKKGRKSYPLLSLFPYETFPERRFKIASIGNMLFDRATRDGIDTAIALYSKIKSYNNPLFAYKVGEDEILHLGKKLTENGKVDETKKIIQFLINEFPKSENVNRSIAEGFERLGDVKSAIVFYQKTLEINPYNGEARYKFNQLTWAEILKNKGIDELIKYLVEAKSRNSEFITFGEVDLNTLGYIMLGRNQFEDAIKVFTLYTEFYPKSANAWDSLAETYMKAGKITQAIESYEKSLKLDPNNKGAEENIKKMKAAKK